MGTRKLFDLRRHWHASCEGCGVEPGYAFLQYYGHNAQFVHIGVDSRREQGKIVLEPQIHTVFRVFGGSGASSILPCTLNDLHWIARALKTNHFNQEVHQNMTRQIDKALTDYETHKPLIDSRVPAARHMRLA